MYAKLMEQQVIISLAYFIIIVTWKIDGIH